MTDSHRFKRMKLLRSNCIDEIEDLKIIANQVKTDSSVSSHFRVRCLDLDSLKDAFMKHHQTICNQIITSEEGDLATENTIRKTFMNDFYSIKATYLELFNNQRTGDLDSSVLHTSTPTRSNNEPLLHTNFRLPAIEIPSFKGDYKTFTTFKDMFDALIHQSSISDIEKFNYLISFLEGPPLSLIRTLPLTAANYKTAYDTLVERYSNKRLRAQSHWLAIENAPKLSSQNSKMLRTILDTFSENLAALKNMKFPIEQWDFVMMMTLMKKLDNELITKFELEFGSSEVPTYKNLESFLTKCCTAFDSIQFSQKQQTPQSKNFMKTPPNKYLAGFSDKPSSSTSQNMSCPLCKDGHVLYRCSIFLNKTPLQRFNFCKSLRLCLNCLSNIHTTPNCKSTLGCHTCSKRHHTLLHFSTSPQNEIKSAPISELSPPNQGKNSSQYNQESNSTQNSSGQSSSQNTSLVCAEVSAKSQGVLLATVLVDVLDSKNGYHTLRCLLDSGSMTSFITEKSVTRLGLKQQPGQFHIQGLNTMNTQTNSGSVSVSLKPIGTQKPFLHVDAVVLRKICDKLPFAPLKTHAWSHIQNINLADPGFNIPSHVDMLLSADTFSKILLDGHISSGLINQPDAINTIFGYAIMGRFDLPYRLNPSYSFLCSSEDSDLQNTLNKFWEIESVPTVPSISREDKVCEDHFLKTIQRSDDGKYIVSLPFKENLPAFPGSRDLAISRFLSVERRLLKEPNLYDEYSKFMREYLDLGHMEVVEESDNPVHSFYIPHFCILRPESTTTPLRVVFNGAAKSGHLKSLNDQLYAGPKLQQDIVAILLRFRLYAFVFSADIKMMYRMIWVNSIDCEYQRIIWRFSSHLPLQVYRLLTVVYGLSSSPFLALRTLRQLITDEGKEFPLAVKVLEKQTFIDDAVAGANTSKDAKMIMDQLIGLLRKGGFELRKWSSNFPQLLEDFPKEYLSKNPLNFHDHETQNQISLKILGLQWHPINDCFTFKCETIDRPCTKRTILSELARVYDPLGYVTPVTFFTKEVMQSLWAARIGWDDTPPPETLRVWNQYKKELPSLSQLSIPRRVTFDNVLWYDLVGFCDASTKGYAAVLYLRSTHEDNTITARFLCAKSKVAPLKVATIPRLELCSAVLLSKLISYIQNTLSDDISFRNIFAFSDSQVALAWIKSDPHKWKTFVSHRVAYIQDRVAPDNWYHVSSENNAADLGSRGCLPHELIENVKWFEGPLFLKDSTSSYFSTYLPKEQDNLVSSEARHISLITFSSTSHLADELLEKHSSILSVQRIIAYLLRFINKSRKKRFTPIGPLTPSECQSALFVLVKHTQQVHFEHELNNKSFSKPLRKLKPFIDKDGILRVGGRLEYSSLSYDRKHPILLPTKSRFTQLLIESYHKTYLHVGLRTLHFLIAQHYWILSPKRSINSVLHKCVKCWKVNPKPYEPQMGNLPPSRISQVKAFSVVGVDFGGPYQITMGRYRGVKTQKAYICLFVCFATKALHLELVGGLSTEAFLSALQRFISRRGRCSEIYSDCGTNFTGANNDLIKMFKNAVSKEQITWHFNPPSAPHFGGLWEAGIRSVKNHISKIVGQQILTYEEFNTYLILVESILNSRPLTPLSSDIEDIHALTPSHFLTLEPVSALPTPDYSQIPLGRLSRWQLLQRLHRDFWNRWHHEYLHTLQQRSKWLDPSSPPQIGTLVLVKHENLPPCQWLLGRLISLKPGADGIARVAEIKTANGLLTRPLVKLCPLPVPLDEKD